MNNKTIALLALNIPTLIAGMALGIAAVGQPPELAELQECAIWNKAQLRILSNSDYARLGFKVERGPAGDIISVSCVRKPETDQFGQPLNQAG